MNYAVDVLFYCSNFITVINQEFLIPMASIPSPSIVNAPFLLLSWVQMAIFVQLPITITSVHQNLNFVFRATQSAFVAIPVEGRGFETCLFGF